MSVLVTPAGHLGDFYPGEGAFYFTFCTHSSTGAPTTLAGTPVLSCYKNNGTTETTTGVALTVDFDARTGLNLATITPSSDTTTFATGGSFSIVITTGTVGGASVVGTTVATFTVNHSIHESYLSVDTSATTYKSTFKLKGIDVQPESGNNTAIRAAGIGTGRGIYISSAGTSAALDVIATANSSYAASFSASGTGSYGIYVDATSTSSIGMRVNGAAQGIYATASAGTALDLISTGGNGHGLRATANGTGYGLYALSGTGASGDGARFHCQSTAGYGFFMQGSGAGSGAFANGGASGHGFAIQGGSGGSGHGLYCFQPVVGGTGYGVYGYSQGGSGLVFESSGTYACLVTNNAASGNAMFFSASGSGGRGLVLAGHGTGLDIQGGAFAGSGVGLRARSVSSGSAAVSFEGHSAGAGAALSMTPGPTGVGLYVVGGSTSGNAAEFTGRAGNANGFSVTGQGSGSGVVFTGGATGDGALFAAPSAGTGYGFHSKSGTGATGDGVRFESLATNGYGLYVAGNGTGAGSRIVGGATGNGLELYSGATSGSGLYVIAQTSGTGATFAGAGVGQGVYVTSGNGAGAVALQLSGAGTGASHGAYIFGNATGNGMYITSGTGAANAAVRIVAAGTGDSHGVYIDGVNTGHGIYSRSGAGATGDGARLETRAANGSGLYLLGIGTGAGLKATNSSGDDVNAADGVWPVSTVLTGAITSASFAAGAIDAAAIAANAIGASELAADAVAEIQSGLATSAALATVQADTDDIQSRLPAALVGGRMDSSVGAVAAGAITAAAIATGAIDADALAADAVAEIADGVWDEAQSGHTTAGTFGKYLDIEVSSRLAPTVSGRTLDVTTGGAAGVDWANVEGQATAVNLSATNIDTDQVVASVTGNVGGNVTGTIGGLTAAALADFFDTNSGTTYGAAVAGSVVKEIVDNSGGTPPTAGQIADAVWDEARAGHVAGGTFGEYVTADVQLMDGSTTAADNLRRSALLMLPGTVGVGSSPSVIVTTAAAGLDTNALKDRTIVWEGNVTAALKYEPAVVTLSTGTNITLDRSLTTAPASGDTFMVV